MTTPTLTINPTIPLLNAFSPGAKNLICFDVGAAVHSAAAAAAVQFFRFGRSYPDAIEIDDYVAGMESVPQLAAALAEARKELAQEFYDGAASLAGLRLAKGLSQAQLAQRVGTSQPALAMWESGKRTPKLASVRRLAKALDADLDTVASSIGAAGGKQK